MLRLTFNKEIIADTQHRLQFCTFSHFIFLMILHSLGSGAWELGEGAFASLKVCYIISYSMGVIIYLNFIWQHFITN
ncbi:uncharacterized protein F4822DRAFT_415985 [Hypoxylon trugodes]|uniref:uncharacterized protein n=1 Tax=Hypoxylon trugodes TaxID=326681 RepID=UPI00219D421D|nr:uncharacterized protein F4822DRAFT_415985 [Hypoxylon trugodes]KAI1384694.1 hypothetical protein F4822DRAFT_415985 [Hypoxylon trugodes]